MGYLAGSGVLMADYSWKDIYNIRKDDIILGADLIPATVTESSVEFLNNQQMMSFLENPMIRFTDTFLIWAKNREYQWWWVENPIGVQNAWKNFSKNISCTKIGLKTIDSFLLDYDVEFATLNGFEKRTVIDVTDDYLRTSITPFFRTDRSCPIIINGYVVSAGLNEYIYDYTKFNWLDSYAQLVESGKLNLIKNGLL